MWGVGGAFNKSLPFLLWALGCMKKYEVKLKKCHHCGADYKDGSGDARLCDFCLNTLKFDLFIIDLKRKIFL